MQYCIERVLIKCAHILVVVEGEEWGEVFLGSDFSLGIHHRKEEGRSLSIPGPGTALAKEKPGEPGMKGLLTCP